MFEPLNMAALTPIGALMALGCTWGIWRGTETSGKVLLVLLALVVLCIAGAYAAFAVLHPRDTPFALAGGAILMPALGLLGPALFKRRILAIALTAILFAFWMFAGTGAYVYGACVLFATCI